MKIVLLYLTFVYFFVVGCSSRKESRINPDEVFRERFINNAEILNKQCPIQVDEITIFKNVVVSGNAMIIKTIIKKEYIDQVDFDAFKHKMSENYSKILDIDFINYIDKNNYSIEYILFDEYDKVKTTIVITGKDIVGYLI